MSESLPYYDPRRQGRKHLNTIKKGDRYDFSAEQMADISPSAVAQEGILFHSDGRNALLSGKVQSTSEFGVENAAAFLDEELSDAEMDWGFILENGEQTYGVVAAYTDLEDPVVLEEDEFSTVLAPSIIVHGFEPVRDDYDRFDIHIERYSNDDINPQRL